MAEKQTHEQRMEIARANAAARAAKAAAPDPCETSTPTMPHAIIESEGVVYRVVTRLADEPNPDDDGRDPPALPPEPVQHGFQLTYANAIYKDLPEQDWTVDGILRAGSVCLLGAYGSSGKTWFAIDLLLSIAYGVKWLGRFPCKKGAVVYMDLESGDYELRRRIQQVYLARHSEMEEAEGGLGIPNEAMALCTQPNISMASETFEARVGALAIGRKLVIFDSLAAFSAGVDENTSTMREGLDKLRKIAEETGCSFVILHHTKKTPAKGDCDPREMFRGSSAIFDAVDSAIFFTVQTDKPIRVEQAKNRHGQKFAPFEASITDLESGATVVRASDAKKDDAQPRKNLSDSDVVSDVLGYVSRNPGCNTTEVRGNIASRSEKICAALAQLVREGKMVCHAGRHGKAVEKTYTASVV